MTLRAFLRRFRFPLSAFCFLLLALCLSSFWFAPSLLYVQSSEAPADAIVLLGGECFHRPARAAELFKKGLAPTIIATGTNDWNEDRLSLIANGIAVDAMQFEKNARTTRENADYTVRLLRAEKVKVKRVILVTSWFHSRRALRCFQKAAPEIEFISLPACAGMKHTLWPSNAEGQRTFVFREYLKTAFYCLRYGITPWQ